MLLLEYGGWVGMLVECGAIVIIAAQVGGAGLMDVHSVRVLVICYVDGMQHTSLAMATMSIICPLP